MIVEMKKLNLVAMSYERDRTLTLLTKTGAAQIREQTVIGLTEPIEEGNEEISSRLAKAESALFVLTSCIEQYAGEKKARTKEEAERLDKARKLLKDGFPVRMEEFLEAGALREKCEDLIARLNYLSDERAAAKSEMSRLERAIETARPYRVIRRRFTDYRSTKNTVVKLGAVPLAQRQLFEAEAAAEPLIACEGVVSEDLYLVCVTAHASVKDKLEQILTAAAFSVCPIEAETDGASYFASLTAKKKEAERELDGIAEQFYAMAEEVPPLKLYCDYLAFGQEKAEAAGKMRKTQCTFLLEAYVPAVRQKELEARLREELSAVWLSFSDVPEDETPPTLLQNNSVVGNFEAVTNMYSPPNAREMDPNAVMSFFYSLFLGFIMADIGYGLLMILGGAIVWYKLRAKGGMLKSLGGVFAIGGIFAVIWGFFFNSLFGVSILPSDAPYLLPVAYNLKDSSYDTWSVMGISIPAALVLALLVGIAQLIVGYICRAVQCFRRGQIWDGILDGLVWTVFSIGVLLAVLGLIEEFPLSFLTLAGGITAGAALLISVLTAGRKEKLLGKFTKGFGALYGIINYASDILSYARLYGLMLSGAVIAQIVSQYAVNFITGGNAVFIIVGAVLLIVGHGFNLAIGLLGAYIHDARLQYVEFYGRFYEGEGELFAPIGSQRKYICLTPSGGQGKKETKKGKSSRLAADL